jgi:hypothetical protein
MVFFIDSTCWFGEITPVPTKPMKQTLVSLFALVCGTMLSQATVIFYEGFDYPALAEGNSIENADGGIGWTAPWTVGNSQVEYHTTGLAHSTSLPTGGGSVILRGSLDEISRTFDTSGVRTDDGAVQYISMLVNPQGNDPKTSFILIRLTWSDTPDNDQVAFWINPVLLNGLLGDADETQTGNFDTSNNVNEIYLPDNNGESYIADEFRMGTTLNDVMLVPEPAATALLGTLLFLGLILRRK